MEFHSERILFQKKKMYQFFEYKWRWKFFFAPNSSIDNSFRWFIWFESIDSFIHSDLMMIQTNDKWLINLIDWWFVQLLKSLCVCVCEWARLCHKKKRLNLIYLYPGKKIKMIIIGNEFFFHFVVVVVIVVIVINIIIHRSINQSIYYFV